MLGLPFSRTARRTIGPPPGAGASFPRPSRDLAAARRYAAALGRAADPGAPAPRAGDLAALDLLHEIGHLVVRRAAELVPAAGMGPSGAAVAGSIGAARVTGLLDAVALEFPDAAGAAAPARLEELLLVRIANENPAAQGVRVAIDDDPLPHAERDAAIAALEAHQRGLDPIGPGGETLVELLRAPARAHPGSLADQLRYVRARWAALLGDALTELLDRLLLVAGVVAEEELALRLRTADPGGPGRGEAPSLGGFDEEAEGFSSDAAWMPRLVLLAKSTHVWLDQLSRRHGREIRALDAIPDEELDRLAHRGITGLWLIGLWRRSVASQRIKAWRGNPDAAASAYALDDYVIADDLGGEAAWADLRARAWRRGIRLASDMVPNHMGIDSRWLVEHPEWFLALPAPPYPSYAYGGGNLADDARVEIRLEDHYWDGSDAAVTFERLDRRTGERRYVYHGNDGTSLPWNDTAQLDFSQAAVREQVIRTIIAVARRFPIIRFDAAMVLARKHVRRLWFPEPGEGGGVPSRAEHGSMTREAFDAAMPNEFWREVVDRVAAEAPGTLLLAEAFWLLEGYFVRTLGMHRVYNSAFMHMLRDEENAAYRRVLRETLEFDPEILKRYVNFMNNPDERTAADQFGTGDKYIGVATLLATLPGLPMFGHGQFEGYTEKYGMEFRRALLDERPDERLLVRHEREIVPLLHRRADFAEARDFVLYDVAADGGGIAEDVFAYSNGTGAARSLVVHHNRYAEISGWIRDGVPHAVRAPDGTRRLVRRTLAEALGVADGPADDRWLVLREQRSSLEHLRSVAELRERGLHVHLRAYESRVFWELRELRDPAGRWRRLAERLAGRGVPSLEEELQLEQLGPVHDALRAALERPDDGRIEALVAAVAEATAAHGDRASTAGRIAARVRVARLAADALDDPVARAAIRGWALLGELGTLVAGAPAGPTARAWYDELRMAGVVAAVLRGDGLPDREAVRAAGLVRLLAGLALPGTGRGAAARLVAAWLGDPAVRDHLEVHDWEGTEWLRGEALDELLVLARIVAGLAGGRAAGAVLAAATAAAGRAGHRTARWLEEAGLPAGDGRPAGRRTATSAGGADGATRATGTPARDAEPPGGADGRDGVAGGRRPGVRRRG